MVHNLASGELVESNRHDFGLGLTLLVVTLLFLLLMGLLFALGFWNANAAPLGAAPHVAVRVVDGRMPEVVVEPKAVTAGTMRIPVDVPENEASGAAVASKRAIRR